MNSAYLELDLVPLVTDNWGHEYNKLLGPATVLTNEASMRASNWKTEAPRKKKKKKDQPRHVFFRRI